MPDRLCWRCLGARTIGVLKSRRVGEALRVVEVRQTCTACGGTGTVNA